jgi:hypothetical protein
MKSVWCIGYSQWQPQETEVWIKSDNDKINHPTHYTQGGIECIEAIKAALTADEFRGYIKGTILKYVWRERIKNGDEDLKKAEWFINYFIKNMGVEK